MQGIIQPLFLETWITEEDPVWSFNEILDKVDLRKFRKKDPMDRNGRPAFDYESMLKTVLFGFMDMGYISLRELERKCRQDIRYMYLMQYEKPSFMTYLYYYVDLYNPNTDIVIELPAFRITARDKDGVLLGSEDQFLSVIYPEQHFIYGFQAFSVDDMPETVEFEVLAPEDYNIKRASVMEPYQPLEVENTAVRSDKIVGEIVNPNNETLSNGVVVVLCKNSAGELVGIESTFVDDILAGGSTPFSISIYGYTDIAEIECYANRW